jgi:Lrp/AsnC family transcriptional regulator, regulator for asnA, asnC and gidA
VKEGLDSLDKALIGTLFDDGRLAVSEIAARLGSSTPTVRGRLRHLLATGVLRVAALVNASETPELTIGIVGLSLDHYDLDEMVERLAALDEVNWAAVVTGRYDIICELATTAGMSGLYDFLNVSLQKLGGIQSSEMFVVLKASHKWMLLPQATTAVWTGPAAGGL